MPRTKCTASELDKAVSQEQSKRRQELDALLADMAQAQVSFVMRLCVPLYCL